MFVVQPDSYSTAIVTSCYLSTLQLECVCPKCVPECVVANRRHWWQNGPMSAELAGSRSQVGLACIGPVMSDIPKLLLDSLNPHTRKQAEHALDAYSRQPAFVVHLLQLVLATTNDTAVRLAASVYLKNRVKLGWLDDVGQIYFDAPFLTDSRGRVPYPSHR